MRLRSIMPAAPPRRPLAPQAAMPSPFEEGRHGHATSQPALHAGLRHPRPHPGQRPAAVVVAEQRLLASRNYWVASRWPDGRPHAMPVWGVWHEAAFWFSSSRGSRKVRNLAADPRCVVTTENAVTVVIEGTPRWSPPPGRWPGCWRWRTPRHTSYGIELLDPAVNATIQVRPRWASGWPRTTSPVRPPAGPSAQNEPGHREAVYRIPAPE